MMLVHSKIINAEADVTPLLIFHGLFGMLDNWQTLGQQFAEKRPVHLLDLRNHGRSFHSDEMTFSAMAQDIKNYMDAHEISQAHLLGHSLGGKVVMKFAFDFPESLDKLIVADIAPKAYPPHHQSILKALESVDFQQIEKRSDVDKVLQQYIPEMGVRQFILKNVYRTDEGYAFRFNLTSLVRAYEDIISGSFPLGTSTAKTLFIRGEKSSYILDEDVPLLEHYFPNMQLETVPNAGHWLHAENPTDFYEKVEKFLS